MSKSTRLTALQVNRLKKPGRYGDGFGLWLQIGPTGAKSWLLRFQRDGQARQMGLGPVHAISLAEARERAQEARRALVDGIDPIEARRALRAGQAAEAARSTSFRAAAEAYIAAHRAGWKNAAHAAQWPASLAADVYPVIGDMPVAAIDTAMVLKVLEPIWHAKPESASRIRGRIELVLDWAKARHLRVGENPARWKGHLKMLLPARTKIQPITHHPALPYRDLPKFMAALRKRDGVGSRALEFAILTGARTSEVIKATWDEVDLKAKIWTVPSARMKAGREHRVPLPDRAIAILKILPREGDWIFIGARAGQPLSNMALLAVLKSMGRSDLTTHGFRSTFRDWAAETTNFPREVCEMALAHAVGDKVEAAYRRGDMFAKRRALARAWADYCGGRKR